MARVERGEVAAILVDQQSRLSRFEDDREWATFTMLLLAQQTRLFAADVGEIDLKNHAARSMAYMRRLGDAEWAAKSDTTQRPASPRSPVVASGRSARCRSATTRKAKRSSAS